MTMRKRYLDFAQLAEQLGPMIDTIAVAAQNDANENVPAEVDGMPNPRRCSLRVLPTCIAPHKVAFEIRQPGEDHGRPCVAEVTLSDETGGIVLRIKAGHWLDHYTLRPTDDSPLPGQAAKTLRVMLKRQVWAGREHQQRKVLERFGEEV